MSKSFNYSNLSLLDAAEADGLLGTLVVTPLDEAAAPLKQAPNFAQDQLDYSANRDLSIIPLAEGREEQLNLNVPSQILSTDFPGELDFKVHINPHHGKRSPWMYSSALHQVFTSINKTLPIDFNCKFPPDRELFLRATPIYIDHADQLVTRCINHAHDPEANKGCPQNIRDHIIRCIDRNAFYGGSKNTRKHLYVRVPLHAPPAGSDSRLVHFQFVCKNSCTGVSGMNRRAIEVVFTLEDAQEQILGRRVLKVRISSCPKRDKENAEQAHYQTAGEQQPPRKKQKLDKKHLNGSLDFSNAQLYTLAGISLPSVAQKIGALRAVHGYLASEMRLSKADEAPYKKCLDELEQKMNTLE